MLDVVGARLQRDSNLNKLQNDLLGQLRKDNADVKYEDLRLVGLNINSVQESVMKTLRLHLLALGFVVFSLNHTPFPIHLSFVEVNINKGVLEIALLVSSFSFVRLLNLEKQLFIYYACVKAIKIRYQELKGSSEMLLASAKLNLFGYDAFSQAITLGGSQGYVRRVLFATLLSVLLSLLVDYVGIFIIFYASLQVIFHGIFCWYLNLVFGGFCFAATMLSMYLKLEYFSEFIQLKNT